MAIRRTLAEPPLQTTSPGYPTAEQTRGVSPVTALCCPQDHVERLLLGTCATSASRSGSAPRSARAVPR